MAVIGASQRSLSPIAPIVIGPGRVFRQGHDVVRYAPRVVFWSLITATETRPMTRRPIFAGFAKPATRGWAFALLAWAWGVGHVSLIPALKR